ncbi:MAG TPA: hypothetical protein VMZ26_04340 [Pyrinomonadaceae bacterium]|nr:hypothetical protein [Pyrinomonadaceae bacterium]
MNHKRLFLYMLIASVGVSALIGIGVTLFGDFGDIEVRVLFTTLTVTVTSIFGLACGAFLESGRGKYLPLAGIAFSIVSALMCFLVIWNVFDDSEIFIKSFLTTTLLAAGCSHLCLLSLAQLDQKFAWTRIAAAVCIALIIAIFLYILWLEPIGGSDLIYRTLGVLGILLASITVVTPLLHKLSHRGPDADKIDTEIERLRARIQELEKLRTPQSTI